MFKKISILLIYVTIGLNSALAATPYIGGSLGASAYNSHSGPIATLFGGYGTIVGHNQNIYLGGEGNINFAHYSRYNSTYGLGASFVPGVMLSETFMLYGRAGLDSAFIPNRSLRVGLQGGLGLQKNIAKNWDIRGEYSYSYARSDGQYTVGLLYKFE